MIIFLQHWHLWHASEISPQGKCEIDYSEQQKRTTIFGILHLIISNDNDFHKHKRQTEKKSSFLKLVTKDKKNSGIPATNNHNKNV